MATDAERRGQEQERAAPESRSKRRPRGRPFPRGQSGNPGRQFQLGQSGNPDGRVKDAEIREQGRERGTEAIGKIVEIMRNGHPKDGVRLTAAQELLDRGWGRPKQAVQVETPQNVTVIL